MINMINVDILESPVEAFEIIEKHLENGDDTRAIYVIVFYVEKCFHAKNLTNISELLTIAIGKQNLHECVMIALLRTSSHARDYIDGWKPFLEHVSNELNIRNLNEARLLRGLCNKQN